MHRDKTSENSVLLVYFVGLLAVLFLTLHSLLDFFFFLPMLCNLVLTRMSRTSPPQRKTVMMIWMVLNVIENVSFEKSYCSKGCNCTTVSTTILRKLFEDIIFKFGKQKEIWKLFQRVFSFFNQINAFFFWQTYVDEWI